MSTSIGLLVQRLPAATDRILLLGVLAGSRTEDGWFSPLDVKQLAEALRLPEPSGVPQALSRLADKGLVTKRSSDRRWSVTPLGQEAASSLTGDLDIDQVESAIYVSGGADLSQARHPLIPASLAPVKFALPIKRLLERYPFDQNVFCMTRFPRSQPIDGIPDPVNKVIETARDQLNERGLHLHLASDRAVDDELFGNIAAHMWACKYGLGLFETRYHPDFNDNLQIEVGAMLMTGRRVALLRDINTPEMPTDFVGQIYKSVDFEDLPSVVDAINDWVIHDLGLGKSS